VLGGENTGAAAGDGYRAFLHGPGVMDEMKRGDQKTPGPHSRISCDWFRSHLRHTQRKTPTQAATHPRGEEVRI